jgi:hypothetical protein
MRTNKLKEKKMKTNCPMCNREISVIGKESRFSKHIGINSPLDFSTFRASVRNNSTGTVCYGSGLPSEWTKDIVETRFLNWRKNQIKWTQESISKGKYQGRDLIYVQKILEKEIKELNQKNYFVLEY